MSTLDAVERSEMERLYGGGGIEGAVEIDAGFLAEVYGEIERALSRTILDGVPSTHERSVERLGSLLTSVSTKAHYFLMTQALHQPRRPEYHLRMVNALRAGVADGTIPLQSREDVLLFRLLIHAELSFFPALMEGYLESDELVEILLCAYETVSVHNDNSLKGKSVVLRVKLMRLYSYDQQRRAEHEGSAAGDDDLQELPLEMRMSFAGFNDDVTYTETMWDRHISDYPTAREEDILSSFREMRAKLPETMETMPLDAMES